MNQLVVGSGTVHPVAAQASSDDEVVGLWLASFRSIHTKRGYLIDIRAFRAFVDHPFSSVSLGHVQAFAAGLSGLASASASRRLSAVKSLFGFCHKIGYLAFDVSIPVPLPAIKDTLAERIMSEWNVQRLLELERDPRNAALLRLIYGCGLRVSEACGLRWRDFAPRDKAGQVTVFGKGGKTRVVLLPPSLWGRILALPKSGGLNGWVFPSRKGGGIGPVMVHRIVKAAARRANLPDAVSAHWLRHAHVSHALDRGAPVHVVRATVGHASLETTTRYSHARPGDSSARYLTV